MPSEWQPDANYRPGSRVLLFYSPETSAPDKHEQAALLTLYTDIELDIFGKQLLSGTSGVTVLTDSRGSEGIVHYRYITFVSDNAATGGGKTRGAFIYVDKGTIAMSATITAREQYWDLHAEKAEHVLRSIVPKCSREALSASYNDDGTAFLCGPTLPAALDSNPLPN